MSPKREMFMRLQENASSFSLEFPRHISLHSVNDRKQSLGNLDLGLLLRKPIIMV